MLAESNTGATNYEAGLSDFVARTAGTYYLVVTGGSGTHYSLVVTRSAGFDTEKNDTFATAQQLDTSGVALAALVPGIPPFFALDDNLTNPPFPIYQTNPETGEFGPSIPAPATEENSPYGLNMAYDGTYLYYNDGASAGTNTFYRLDPSTGAILRRRSLLLRYRS